MTVSPESYTVLYVQHVYIIYDVLHNIYESLQQVSVPGKTLTENQFLDSAEVFHGSRCLVRPWPAAFRKKNMERCLKSPSV